MFEEDFRAIFAKSNRKRENNCGNKKSVATLLKVKPQAATRSVSLKHTAVSTAQMPTVCFYFVKKETVAFLTLCIAFSPVLICDILLDIKGIKIFITNFQAAIFCGISSSNR